VSTIIYITQIHKLHVSYDPNNQSQMKNLKQVYLNPKWAISKCQNEIDDKFKLNSEAMSYNKCTLPSSVIQS
jgi:hypothetical protein